MPAVPPNAWPPRWPHCPRPRLRRLRLLLTEKLVRSGEGGRGTPYAYTLTQKGRADVASCQLKVEADARGE